MVEMYLGRKSKFSFAKESSYGGGNSATDWAWAGFMQSFEPNDSQNLTQLNPMDGETSRTVGEYYPMIPSYGGSLELVCQHLRFPSMVLGSDSVSGTSEPYTHTISLDDDIPSFAMEAGYIHSSNSFGKEYTGCKLRSLNINWAQNDFVRFNMDVVAQDVSKVTSFRQYQSSPDSLQKYTSAEMEPYRSTFSKFMLDGNDMSEYVTSATLSINNDMREEESLADAVGNVISEPIPQIVDMNATLSLKMKESTYWDLWKSGTELTGDTYFQTFKSDGTTNFKCTMSKPVFETANSPINVTEGVVVQEINLNFTDLTMVEENGISEEYTTICA